MSLSNTFRYLVFAASLCCVAPSWALDPERTFFQYAFEAPSERVGLPDDIHDLAQSKDGSLWLATARGLARFDGVDFELFRVSRYPEVLSNSPTKLFVDSKDRLFIASEYGLSIYDGVTFRELVIGSKWATRVDAIAEDEAGVVWFGSDSGVWRYVDGEVSAGPLDESVGQIGSIFWHDDTLFVGARGRVYLLRGSTQTEVMLPLELERAVVLDMEYHEGKIWVATRDALLTLQAGAIQRVESTVLEDVAFDSLLADRDGNLWFMGRDHLGRFLPDGQIELPDILDNSYGFGPQFTAILEDEQGRFWQTSRYLGLVALTDTSLQRVSYTEGLPSANVTAIAPGGDHSYYAATDKGVALVDNGDVTPIIDEEFQAGSEIRTMLVDEQQRLILGTAEGLRIYDLQKRDWVADPVGLQSDIPVNVLVRSDDGGVWMGTDIGLFSMGNGRFDAVFETSGLSIESLLLDSRGVLWLGAENGIARIVNGRFERISEESTGTVRAVVSLLEMPSGNVVAATADQGIVVFDGERWSRFGETHGIPPESIMDLGADGASLFLFTGSGVFRTSILSDEQFGTALGDVRPVATHASYRGPYTLFCCRGENGSTGIVANNVVVASTEDGVIEFGLDAPSNTGAPPIPYLQSVSSDGQLFDVAHGEEVQLTSIANELRVVYSTVQLDRGYQVEFRYRLLGQSNDWVDVGDSRVAQFQNLPPGDYSFELQASLYPDVWSDAPIGFEFKRMPIFTETRAFQILLWSALVGASLLLIWWRMASARKRHKRLEVEIRERTAALSDLNKELKSANTALQHSSQTDPLTGLINRRYFDTAVDPNQIPASIADHGVLMTIDIDHFKRVNDAYGHAAGDEVLCQFASVLRSCTRQSDLVIRWGGEEFVVICRCPNDDAAGMLDRLSAAVRGHSFTLSSGKSVSVTCSIGCVKYPIWEDVSFDRRLSMLMRLADAALYLVKMTGRDGWTLLEGGRVPVPNIEALELDVDLNCLVEGEHIAWSASRANIAPSLYDTVTRLHAIKRNSGG